MTKKNPTTPVQPRPQPKPQPTPHPKPQPNWPSKVPGNPSGPGRDNNPPRK